MATPEQTYPGSGPNVPSLRVDRQPGHVLLLRDAVCNHLKSGCVPLGEYSVTVIAVFKATVYYTIHYINIAYVIVGELLKFRNNGVVVLIDDFHPVNSSLVQKMLIGEVPVRFIVSNSFIDNLIHINTSMAVWTRIEV